MAEKLKNIPDIREDSLIISADKDSMANYMEEAYERNSRTLFNECVANLSRDAAFMLVADMNKISRKGFLKIAAVGECSFIPFVYSFNPIVGCERPAFPYHGTDI